MTYVLADAHGNLERFKDILRQINLQPSDTLIILGDVLDRFPDGIKILLLIMKMPNVKMILGNHEFMMLNAIGDCRDAAEERLFTNERALRLWYRNGGQVTHRQLKHLRKDLRAKIFDYLRKLPLNLDVEVNGIKYKLVHGSPLENYMHLYSFSSEYRTLTEFAVWERWNECMPVPEGFILVFGHTPTIHFPSEEPWSVWKSDEAIGIDCGCAYPEGRLGCLRLDDMAEFYSSV